MLPYSLCINSIQSEFEGLLIIAVHGLNPRSKKAEKHAWNTWREPQDDKGRLWLRDDLPKSAPDARIFLYEYDSTVVYSIDRSTFIDKANELLEAIRIKRGDDVDRPIVLLGHSLGGLLIEQALVNAHNNPKYTPIQKSVSGLAFFATPHDGGNSKLVAIGDFAAKIALALGFQKGDNLVQTLASGSLFTDTLREHWRHQLLKYDIISFWGSQDNIVPRDSARFGLPGAIEHIVKLNADHHSLCRFGYSQIDEDNFELVEANIRELYKQGLKLAHAKEVERLKVDTKSAEERKRFLQGLVKSDDETRQGIDYESYRFRNPNSVPGTCTWFLEHKKYLNWRDEPSSSLLWLSADPGCGKSVIASFLVGELQTPASQKALEGTVCHFFFKDDNKRQSGAVYALRAILHQLLSKRARLPGYIVTEYENKGDAIFGQFGSLWKCFIAAATESYQGNTICILDGLDECEFNLKDLLTAMVQFYEPIKAGKDTSNAPFLKIILTSRPENAIQARFSRLPTIRLRGEDESEATEHDIGLVVSYSVNEMVEQGLLSQCTSDLLRQKLVANADQTFLWVALILALIKDATEYGASEYELSNVLEDRGIDSLYSKFLSKSASHPETEKKARLLLQIIIAAPRPLTLVEMDTAISLQPAHLALEDLQRDLHKSPENYLKQLCGHFIRCKDQKVYLVHQTARDFLIRQDDNLGLGAPERGPWQHWVLPQASHALLAIKCVQYLFLQDFNDMTEDFMIKRSQGESQPQIQDEYRKTYPFLQYATTYWHYHTRLGQSELNDWILANILVLGNTRSTRFWSWFYIFAPWWSAALTTEHTCLNYLALANLTSLEALDLITCPPCLGIGATLDEIQALKSTYTPFEWAAKENYSAITDLLLRLNPKLKKSKTPGSLEAGLSASGPYIIGDETENEAVHAFTSLRDGASRWESVELEELLPVSDQEEQSSSEDDEAGDEERDQNYAQITSLLATDAEALPTLGINVRDENGDTPILRAARLGHASIVNSLLHRPGINVNIRNKHAETALWQAAKNGHSIIVAKLLAVPGVNVNMRDRQGTTALRRAVHHGHEEIVRQLLEVRGIDIHTPDEYGTTPLRCARDHGIGAILLQLLAKANEPARITT